MDHSVTARYAARPAAHFPRRAARARAVRLGLVAGGSFRAAAPRATVLHDAPATSLARLRAARGSLRIVAPRRSRHGAPRPTVAMHWTATGRPFTTGRSAGATSPWHG